VGASAPSEPVDLGDAMVDMMIAQRAFAAQLRVLRTADQMLDETVNLRE
jgi:flagellar hook protein FlgE